MYKLHLRVKKILKKAFTVILLGILISTLTLSCLDKKMDFDDIEESEWNSEWAIPLINSEFSIQDILNQEDGVVQIEEGGLIKLVYESNDLLSIQAAEQIGVPDQDMNSEQDFILPDIPPGIENSITLPFNLSFSTDTTHQRADSSYFKTGNFEMFIETNLNKESAYCIIRYPSILEKDSREMLQHEFDLNYTGGLINREAFANLDNYIFIYNSENNQQNMLGAEVIITYTSDDNTILPDYYFHMNTVITDITYSDLFGYLGQYDYTLEDTIYFDVFSSNTSGSLIINPEAIQFYITAHNSYGMPIELTISEFLARHSGPEPVTKDIFLFGEGNPAIIELNYPNYSQIGQFRVTNINTSESNIAEVIEISPDEIQIIVAGVSNPENDSTVLNFVQDTSSFHMDIRLELGLHGTINSFEIQDTFDLELNTDAIDLATFMISTVNRFPIDADLQIYFVDSVYTVLDSLITKEDQMVFNGADIGPPPELRIIEPVDPYAVSIVLDEAGLRQINDATNMILKASLQTTDGQEAKIYEDYTIAIRLGVIAGVPY